jgi:hypothetical protein
MRPAIQRWRRGVQGWQQPCAVVALGAAPQPNTGSAIVHSTRIPTLSRFPVPVCAAVGIAGLLLLVFAAPALAQSAPASHPCTAVVAPLERLACYDAAFPRSATAIAESKAVAEAQARQEFGLSERERRERDAPGLAEPVPERLESTVARLDFASNGARIITLDNGQVWQQSEVSSKGRLAIGDRVVLRNAALGSFMLVTPARVALRVRRLR